MGKGKKKFISKDKAVTFHLVHRSQQDPLITDEHAPQHVLQPAKRQNKEEEHKYGIFFDDDYDYLQHLKGDEQMEVHWEQTERRDRPAKPKKMQLPSSVFASSVEESVGLLNKAAPQSGLNLDLDPDIVAAMDDDFDFDDPENQLDDDFMQLANQEGSDDGSYETIDEEDGELDMDSDDLLEDDDEVGELDRQFADVETKSRFTDYSLSSSVIRRNDKLSLLDDRFEKMFEGYDKTEIGALDCEEIEGDMLTSDARLMQLVDQHANAKNQKMEREDLKERIVKLMEEQDEEDEGCDRVCIEKKERWDCESILSTYSNIYNHPAKIIDPPRGPRKIRVNKMGVAAEELDGRGAPKLTAKNLATLDGANGAAGPKSIISMVSELSIRPPGETVEERRLRKANLREYRKERRIEKKANTEAFKNEKVRQEKIRMNMRNNLQGAKIL